MKEIHHRHRRLAFSLVELLVIVVALALLAAMLMPALVKRKKAATRTNCANNLKQVSLAFRIWAGDYGDRNPMRVSTTNGGTMEWGKSGAVWPHFQVMSNELNTPWILVCPEDGPRVKAQNRIYTESLRDGTSHFSFQKDSPVSYFVGLDADETQPNMLLVGDGNLEVNGKPVSSGILNLWTNSIVGWTAARHIRQGYVALADGSVQQYSNPHFRRALAETGVATNRLAIP